VPLLNKLTAEDAVSTPSVFQLLPHGAAARFLDENLKPLAVNLYDVSNWRKYGWSPVFNQDFRQRYEARLRETNPSSDDHMLALDSYLAATLKRTQRFHQALDAFSDQPPVKLLAIGGDCEETLNAPVVIRDPRNNRWLTLVQPKSFKTSSGVKVSSKEVTQAMYAMGDGRVTRASLLGENLPSGSGVNQTLRLAYAVFGCDLHGQLQRNKTLQDNALTAVVTEAMQ
jgi:hypothetical protein